MLSAYARIFSADVSCLDRANFLVIRLRDWRHTHEAVRMPSRIEFYDFACVTSRPIADALRGFLAKPKNKSSILCADPDVQQHPKGARAAGPLHRAGHLWHQVGRPQPVQRRPLPSAARPLRTHHERALPLDYIRSCSLENRGSLAAYIEFVCLS